MNDHEASTPPNRDVPYQTISCWLVLTFRITLVIIILTNSKDFRHEVLPLLPYCDVDRQISMLKTLSGSCSSLWEIIEWLLSVTYKTRRWTCGILQIKEKQSTNRGQGLARKTQLDLPSRCLIGVPVLILRPCVSQAVRVHR